MYMYKYYTRLCIAPSRPQAAVVLSEPRHATVVCEFYIVAACLTHCYACVHAYACMQCSALYATRAPSILLLIIIIIKIIIIIIIIITIIMKVIIVIIRIINLISIIIISIVIIIIIMQIIVAGKQEVLRS